MEYDEVCRQVYCNSGENPQPSVQPPHSNPFTIIGAYHMKYLATRFPFGSVIISLLIASPRFLRSLILDASLLHWNRLSASICVIECPDFRYSPMSLFCDMLDSLFSFTFPIFDFAFIWLYKCSLSIRFQMSMGVDAVRQTKTAASNN